MLTEEVAFICIFASAVILPCLLGIVLLLIQTRRCRHAWEAWQRGEITAREAREVMYANGCPRLAADVD